MERLPKETLESIIGIQKTTLDAFEKYGSEDSDYNPSLDKCILALLEELKQYRIAEEQGLLLRLPFKIGNPLYWIATECDANKHPADACDIYENCEYCPHNDALIVVEGKVRESHIMRFIQGTIQDKIGKDYFLTKKEAEQALARMEKENG